MPSIFIQHVSRRSKLSGTEAESIYMQESFLIVQFSLLRLEENILGCSFVIMVSPPCLKIALYSECIPFFLIRSIVLIYLLKMSLPWATLSWCNKCNRIKEGSRREVGGGSQAEDEGILYRYSGVIIKEKSSSKKKL